MHEHQVTPAPEWAERLREHGLRVTSGRIAALGYIASHPHSSVADIHTALTHELPSFSQQSVHNIAHDLTKCGLLRRVDLPGTGSALYETRTHDNHHHVQCIVCLRIEDIDCVVGEAPCLTPEHTHGMHVLEAAVTYRGVCDGCAAKDPSLLTSRSTSDHSTTSPHTPTPTKGTGIV